MSKIDLSLNTPLMNAAGFLGFAPDLHGPVDLARLGAFVTNPISLEPRSPAHNRRCQGFPGGVLLHTGYPNPGFRAVVRQQRARWARSPLPIIVHLLASQLEDLRDMAHRLETLEGVAGIELGLPPEVGPGEAGGLVSAATGELPLVVRLPLDRALGLASAIVASGAAAVSLGAPYGSLPDSLGGWLQGRLYGQALFPQALACVRSLVQAGIPVFGAGGIYDTAGVEAMLSAGAQAVQLDTVLWRGGWGE